MYNYHMIKETAMDKEASEYRFEDAVADPTLWEGYEQWLDQMAKEALDKESEAG